MFIEDKDYSEATKSGKTPSHGRSALTNCPSCGKVILFPVNTAAPLMCEQCRKCGSKSNIASYPKPTILGHATE